jgi:cell division topological specificity factor
MAIFDFFRRRDNAAEVARERLLKVLVDDRFKLPPDQMAQLRHDLTEVLRRYFPNIEADAVDVSVQRNETVDVLKADVPLRRATTHHS